MSSNFEVYIKNDDNTLINFEKYIFKMSRFSFLCFKKTSKSYTWIIDNC